MVAVTILVIAAAGPLVTASRAIVSAQIARDQLTALYLAQQGVEHARAVRDDAYLAAYSAGGSDVSERAWDAFLGACSGTACTPALISGAFGSFARSVEVSAVTATDALVSARVTWTYKGTPYAVSVADHLTAWQ